MKVIECYKPPEMTHSLSYLANMSTKGCRERLIGHWTGTLHWCVQWATDRRTAA